MSKFTIIDEILIDPDRHIKAILFNFTPNWYVQFQAGKGKSRQKRRSLGTRSKKQARIKAFEFARNFDGRAPRRRQRVTIEEAAAARRERCRARGRTEETLLLYETLDRQLIKWATERGLYFLDELTLPTLEAFEKTLRETGIHAPPPPRPGPDGRPRRWRYKGKAKPLNNKTVRDKMVLVRSMMRFARQRGLIDEDPAPGYERPIVHAEEIEIFTPEELALILADPDPRLNDIWRFYYQQCLRAEELAWLTKEDVLLDASGRPAHIAIRPKTCPLTGKPWWPKHKISRTIPLSAAAAEIAQRQMSISNAPWVFEAPDTTGPQVGKWQGQRLLRTFQAYLTKAGVAYGVLHQLRHTGASHKANHPTNPWPVPVLSRFLGHRSLVMTERYVHVVQKDMTDAMKRLDAANALKPPQQSNAPSDPNHKE